MRSVHPFSQDWLYLASDAGPEIPDSAFESVTVPHANVVLPHHNFDNRAYQFISTYRRRFDLPEPRDGRRVFLDFDGAMIACEVHVNGWHVGGHEGGFTPFSFDVTDWLNENGPNLLNLRLDSTERPDIPPYGFVVDYLTFGGLYRDVWLRYVEPCHIHDVFVKPSGVLTDRPRLTVQLKISEPQPQLAAMISLVEEATENTILLSGPVPIPIRSGADGVAEVMFEQLPKVDLWTLEHPALYRLNVKLFRGRQQLDEVSPRFGFREAEFRRDGGFYLNGARLKLMGLNRHQTYPFVGCAAPARLQRKDADIVKYELGCNIVRTSHYPQSPHFLDRCDEIGLLVFEEIPGWQHIGDRDWQGVSLRDVQAMIERDRNRPSVVLWGVRINESQDNEALYTATNALARRLDPTRQTGGVRYFLESQFLEDVFTYNDFSNTVVEPLHLPHLVSEFGGHMFPTKIWDQEERLIEHALLHARIQDRSHGMDTVAGAIGWCAYDYNTHREFGSGDRICYHGVMDIFRLPKYAAYFYESQIDPQQRAVLRAATVWSVGDRSGGGNDPLVVFSNCEELDVFIGEDYIGRYRPDRAQYPYLPHPPFQIPGLAIHVTWGRPLSDLRLCGLIGGQIVAEQRISAQGIPSGLDLQIDDAVLNADGVDMTRLVFRIVDEFGNRLPYTNQIVTFTCEGPADLIGENPFAIMGGQAALYVRAGRKPGIATIRATTPRLEPAMIEVEIR